MGPSKRYVLGFDLDGVLADWIRGAYEILNSIRPLIKDVNADPTCWNFPTEQFGYTEAEFKQCRETYWADPQFWFKLKPLFQTEVVLTVLSACYAEGHGVYFISDRAGVNAHAQTCAWLMKHGYQFNPQVLLTPMSRGKGGAARSLGLTHFIDDKPENCFQVKEQSPDTQVFLLKRPWNDKPPYLAQANRMGITVITSVKEFFDILAEEERVNAIVV